MQVNGRTLFCRLTSAIFGKVWIAAQITLLHFLIIFCKLLQICVLNQCRDCPLYVFLPYIFWGCKVIVSIRGYFRGGGTSVIDWNYKGCVLEVILPLPEIRVWRNFHENVGGQRKGQHEYGEESRRSDHQSRQRKTACPNRPWTMSKPSNVRNGSALREWGWEGTQPKAGVRGWGVVGIMCHRP